MRYYYFLLLFLLPYFSGSQTNGLLAYYAFDGSAVDSSSFEHHGTVVNAVLSMDLLDNTDRAYVFNGTNSYITAGSPETLKVDTALTVSVWFRAIAPGSPSAGGILVNKEGEYSFARFADGSIRYALAFNNFWTVHVNTNVLVPLQEDTHAVLTYSKSSGQVKVYINCELVYVENENATIGDFKTDMNELRIGGRMFLDQFFEGIIDEVKIFNRALSFEEIRNNCDLVGKADTASEKCNFLIYPNPTKDYISIEGDISKIRKMLIFDLSGRTLREISAGFQEISLEEMPSGLYIIAGYGKNNKLLLGPEKVVKFSNRM